MFSVSPALWPLNQGPKTHRIAPKKKKKKKKEEEERKRKEKKKERKKIKQ